MMRLDTMLDKKKKTGKKARVVLSNEMSNSILLKTVN